MKEALLHGFRRYAVYYVPDGPLGAWGAAWLGWDVAAGEHRAHPRIVDLPAPAAELTATPRRYGFHATLKPPFRPAEGADPARLLDGTRELAASLTPVTCAGLELRHIGGFLALVPGDEAPAIATLAARLVEGLDEFRAPLAATELERRRAAGLSSSQDALLRRWGYPYLMEAFRFHLTLTGNLPSGRADAVEVALGPVLAPLLPGPLRITDVALVGEDEQGWFHLVERLPLTG